MLMKVQPIDFHQVDDIHAAIHRRLENWARYVAVHPQSWIGPIWKLGKSHGRQWHAPDLKDPVNTLDGHYVEKLVRQLPEKHREAIRWSYVYKDSPARKAKQLAVNYDGLMDLVRKGRSMLKNTCTAAEYAVGSRAIDRADA